MPKRNIGPISKVVRDLVRDRLNDRINDPQVKQRLSNLIDTNQGMWKLLFSDIGEALARWIARYLYLLTDNVSPNIGRGRESDWGIVMKWGKGEIKDDSLKALCYSRLQSPQSKAVFEQQLTGYLRQHQGDAQFIEDVHAKVLGGVLDYFFHLADQVDDRIRQDFKKHHVDPMST